MLTVDTPRDAGKTRRQERIQSGQIARVHDGRAKLPTQSKNRPSGLPDADARSVKGENFDVRPAQTRSEIGIVFDARDRMTKPRFGHPVDKIDETILHPSD